MADHDQKPVSEISENQTEVSTTTSQAEAEKSSNDEISGNKAQVSTSSQADAEKSSNDEISGNNAQVSTASQAGAEKSSDDEEITKFECLSETLEGTLMEMLSSMGFAKNRTVRALYYTKNVSLEAALEWLETHQDDSNVDLPIPEEEIEFEDGSSSD
eukprot:643001_1